MKARRHIRIIRLRGASEAILQLEMPMHKWTKFNQARMDAIQISSLTAE